MQDRYRVVTGPPLSPSSVSAEELEGLADALNALSHPAATALNDLTVNAVELAFNSLSPRHRQDLLDRLGIRIAALGGQASPCAETFWAGCSASHGSTPAHAGSKDSHTS